MALDLLFFANGFHYKNDAEELLALKRNKREVTTPDMKAISLTTPGITPFGIEFFDHLVEILGKLQEKVSILRIMGHADPTGLAFKGELDPSEDGAITHLVGQMVSVVMQYKRQAVLKAIKGRFTSDAQIILYGCHSGGKGNQAGTLMQITADLFGVPVRGFRHPLEACIKIILIRRRQSILIANRDVTRRQLRANNC